MSSGLSLHTSIPFGGVHFPIWFIFLAALINKARRATRQHVATRTLSLAKGVAPFPTSLHLLDICVLGVNVSCNYTSCVLTT